MNWKCIFKHDYNKTIQTHKYISESWSGVPYMREKLICNCCGNIKYNTLCIAMDFSILSSKDENWK